MDVIIGVYNRDDGKIIADFLTNFVIYYFDETIYLHQNNILKEHDFKSVSFHGVLIHKCIKPEIVHYFNNSRRLLNNWIRHNKLRNIFIKIWYCKSCEQFQESKFKDANVKLILPIFFFQPEILCERKIFQFQKYFLEVKRKFCNALLDLQSNNFKQVSIQNYDILKLDIVCDLITTSTSTGNNDSCIDNQDEIIGKSWFYNFIKVKT